MIDRSVICIAGVKRVIALVEELAPGETPHKKKRIVSQILSLLDGKPKPGRMTPELLAELIAVHSQCVHDQEGRCPLTVFVKPLCWEINQAMGVANDEDKGFRRYGEMCAAKPLGAERFDREDK
jgi:hypothetical protein